MDLSESELQTIKKSRSEIRNWPYVRTIQLLIGVAALIAWLLHFASIQVWWYSALSQDMRLVVMVLAGIMLGTTFNDYHIRKAKLVVKLAEKVEPSAA